MIAEIDKEVKELMLKAEGEDKKPLAEGLAVPEEIARREKRKAVLKEAKAAMEELYKEAEEERKKEKEEKGKHSGSKKGQEEYQYNFTESESRIMKVGNGVHFEQCYNAQAAVDTEGSMLILGGYVTAHGNDKKELEPAVASVDGGIREVTDVSADTGYYSEEAVAAVEKADAAGKRTGPEVYCAVGRTGHNVNRLRDIYKKGKR
jgi:Tfp pilus assembly protein PilE